LAKHSCACSIKALTAGLRAALQSAMLFDVTQIALPIFLQDELPSGDKSPPFNVLIERAEKVAKCLRAVLRERAHGSSLEVVHLLIPPTGEDAGLLQSATSVLRSVFQVS
jgi:hypothetical protein